MLLSSLKKCLCVWSRKPGPSDLQTGRQYPALAPTHAMAMISQQSMFGDWFCRNKLLSPPHRQIAIYLRGYPYCVPDQPTHIAKAGRSQQQSKCFFAGQPSSPPYISPSSYFGINCCRRCGSSPIHSGYRAVPSNFDVVLNGSNSPRTAAVAVFDSKECTSSSIIGINVRTVSHA